MAKSDVNVIAMRDEAGAELAQLQDELEAIQEEARGINEANDERAAVVVRIKAAKLKVATKADEYGELARAAALIAGGVNYRPPR